MCFRSQTASERCFFKLCFSVALLNALAGPLLSRENQATECTDFAAILIPLTLYKLACPLSGAEFCSRYRIRFQTQPRYMANKNRYSGALSSSGTENASETPFQTPKLNTRNTPNFYSIIAKILVTPGKS